jgi:hypothetical protein
MLILYRCGDFVDMKSVIVFFSSLSIPVTFVSTFTPKQTHKEFRGSAVENDWRTALGSKAGRLFNFFICQGYLKKIFTGLMNTCIKETFIYLWGHNGIY